MGVPPDQRSADRLAQANGYQPKTVKIDIALITFDLLSVGEGRFQPQVVLEKGWRREPALRLTLAQMYVQAVSTRQVTVITEDQCGTEVSETPVSQASPTIEPNRLPVGGNGFDDQRWEKV